MMKEEKKGKGRKIMSVVSYVSLGITGVAVIAGLGSLVSDIMWGGLAVGAIEALFFIPIVGTLLLITAICFYIRGKM